MSAQQYRRNAAVCLDLAERTVDSEARAGLIEMAGSWLRLATLAEKNSKTDLVYETPPPPAASPDVANR